VNGEPEYYDIRQSAFRAWFEKGLPYEQYLASSDPRHSERWRTAEQAISLTAHQRQLLGSFVRQMPVLCLSGVWCGDCVRQGPIFHAFEKAAPVVDVRFLDREEFPELMDELRICGAKKVPVVVFLTEDFFEVERYGDRTLSVYRRKAERELGPACPVPFGPRDANEASVEIQEWLDIFERVQLMLRLSPPLRRRYND